MSSFTVSLATVVASKVESGTAPVVVVGDATSSAQEVVVAAGMVEDEGVKDVETAFNGFEIRSAKDPL